MYISHTHWYLLLFFTGAASIAVEIAGLRLIAPLFGTSLPIWGAVIATVLAGLSIGYARGGKQAATESSLRSIYQYASLGAALFLWMPAVFQLAMWLRNTGTEERLPLILLASFTLMLLILFFPSVIFGMISPLAVQVEAERRQQAAGQVAGRVSMISTLGSLFGILIPSFITIPFFGTRTTIWLFAGTVLLLCAPFLLKSWRRSIPSLLAIAASLVFQSSPANVLYADETAHQYITVRQEKSARVLAFDASLGIQSLYTDDTYTRGYWDYLAALPAIIPDTENISVLILGAAASTTERQMEAFWGNTKHISFTSVELDHDLFAVADEYFHAPERKKVSADARSFVTSNNDTYDIIVVDVYARELTVPFHLVTQEFFTSLSERLAPGGILAINLNATSDDTLWIQSVSKTVQSVFPHIRLAAIPHSCNYLLLASHMETSEGPTTIPLVVEPLAPVLTATRIPHTDGILLTDDRSPTDLLGFLAFLPDRSRTTPACS